MENIRIEGGADTGAPRNWDEARLGPCLTISVLEQIVDGLVYQTTAWRPSAAELEALNEGGSMWFSINAPGMPVIRLWTQSEAGDQVGDLASSLQREAALRAAVLQIAVELAKRGPDVPRPDQSDLAALKELDWPDLLEWMMQVVSSMPVPINIPGIPTPAVVQIPVLTLEQLGRRRGVPMTGTAADDATQTELERQLGVTLNPDGKGGPND